MGGPATIPSASVQLAGVTPRPEGQRKRQANGDGEKVDVPDGDWVGVASVRDARRAHGVGVGVGIVTLPRYSTLASMLIFIRGTERSQGEAEQQDVKLANVGVTRHRGHEGHSGRDDACTRTLYHRAFTRCQCYHHHRHHHHQSVLPPSSPHCKQSYTIVARVMGQPRRVYATFILIWTGLDYILAEPRTAKLSVAPSSEPCTRLSSSSSFYFVSFQASRVLFAF